MRRFGMRRTVFLCSLFSLIAAVSTVLAIGARRRVNSYPLGTLPPVSLWYWHTPFEVTPDENMALQSMNVRELFVRAATLTYTGNNNDPVRASLRQAWVTQTVTAQATPALHVHLVFPVDATLVRRLEKLSKAELARSLAQTILEERKRAIAQAKGVAIVGVQLDLDCPTRLLPRYATVLKLLRAQLPKTDALSITLLTSWYDSRNISGLLDAVDFSAPQFYEAQTSPTQDKFHPISDLARLSRGLQKAEQLGKPFYIGLPVYGHALVYDGQGRLRGLFHDASAAELLAHPREFHYLGTAPLAQDGREARMRDAFIGEERVEFGPARSGTAFQLTYELPTAEMLRRHLNLLRQERLTKNCRGIILYRFPGKGEESALPLVTTAAVVRGDVPRPNLKIQFRTRRTAPFDLVESPVAATPRTDLYVTVANDGTGPTRVAPDSVTIDLYFQHTVLESARIGSFNQMQGFVDSPEHRSSIARANGLRLTAVRLAPGERRVIGPITLLASDPNAKVEARWHSTLPGGFDTLQGQTSSTSLSFPKEK